MIRWIRCLILLAALVASTTLWATAQETDILDAIKTASEDLSAYSATIQMIRHEARGDSIISFSFDFVPTDRMRIVYTDPASVDGQTMILNASSFYTYIPSINRRVWQDVSEDGNDQGEELGFLYDFVVRAAAAFIDAYSDAELIENGTYDLEGTEAPIDIAKLSFQLSEERQEVWINLADAVPVAVDIYDGDELVMEIRVLSYQVNGPIDDTLFAIPAK